MTMVDAGLGQRINQTASVLLIAYEFPPSPSPQSLRWAYLARGLAEYGHRIHVLAPEHPGSGAGIPGLPESVVVYRTFAGPGMGLLNLLARQRRGRLARRGATVPESREATTPEQGVAGVAVPPQQPLNWKGRVHNVLSGFRTWLFHGVHRLLGLCFFPDGRAEWYPWARKELERILAEQAIDVVVSSHEPATTLSLGLLARQKGYPWIADLGDPVLAPYTPRRWRRRAGQLEREVCVAANLVTVTTEAAAGALSRRHGLSSDRSLVLTQGFSRRGGTPAPMPPFAGGRPLELLYTGSLYRFRTITPLIKAVERTPGIRLNIASIAVPADVLAASRRSPSVRLLGFLPHAQAIEWQERSDVLINLANDEHCQIPGKFYEYLGAGRPILHIGEGHDAAADLLLGIRRGWFCSRDPEELERLLVQLVGDARSGAFGAGLDLSAEAVSDFDWKVISGRLNDRMTTLIAEHGNNDGRNDGR